MRSIGIKVLKNQLSKYIRLAEEGETILVCDRDRVVARLVGPEGGGRQPLSDSLLIDAVRNGYLTPALEHTPPPPSPAGVLPLAEVLAALDRDRSDR